MRSTRFSNGLSGGIVWTRVLSEGPLLTRPLQNLLHWWLSRRDVLKNFEEPSARFSNGLRCDKRCCPFLWPRFSPSVILDDLSRFHRRVNITHRTSCTAHRSRKSVCGVPQTPNGVYFTTVLACLLWSTVRSFIRREGANDWCVVLQKIFPIPTDVWSICVNIVHSLMHPILWLLHILSLYSDSPGILDSC